MKHQACRQTHVILRRVEEVGVNVVSLDTPSQKVEKAIVDAAANAGRNRSIRSKAMRIHVCEAHESFRKRADLANGNAKSRPDDEIVKMGIDADWRAHDSDSAEGGRVSELQIAVVRAKIGKHAEKRDREELAFDGAFPAIETLASRAQVRVVVRITRVEVARSGDLGHSRRGKRQQNESKYDKLAHKCEPSYSDLFKS